MPLQVCYKAYIIVPTPKQIASFLKAHEEFEL